MNISRRRGAQCAGLLVLLTLAPVLHGCRTAPKTTESVAKASIERRPAQFIHLQAVYHFEDPMPLLTRHFQSDDTVESRDQILPTSFVGEWSEADLKIECPHPGGDPDRARLTLTLRRHIGRQMREEVRMLAVPRAQVELLLEDLEQNGFFEKNRHSGDDARLSLTIDGKRREEAWQEDGRLLDLACRTLKHGRVLGQ